jgi:hypothetical protein
MSICSLIFNIPSLYLEYGSVQSLLKKQMDTWEKFVHVLVSSHHFYIPKQQPIN